MIILTATYEIVEKFDFQWKIQLFATGKQCMVELLLYLKALMDEWNVHYSVPQCFSRFVSNQWFCWEVHSGQKEDILRTYFTSLNFGAFFPSWKQWLKKGCQLVPPLNCTFHVGFYLWSETVLNLDNCLLRMMQYLNIICKNIWTKSFGQHFRCGRRIFISNFWERFSNSTPLDV